ncbi:MAG: inositol 2-dehydrogenase [Spirochaetales bacterium]|nr:inositol 2-dehydrogenase [Spirochaetales bacterium]
MKLGIIGAGRIGRVHAESVTFHIPDAEVAAVADPFITEESKKFFNNLGVKEVFKDYKDILAKKEIDAVLICSSTDTHAKITIEAAKAGKDIFCEKPIDLDIGRIKETLKAVKEAGVKFQIGFNRRFDRNFSALKKSVVDGKVGDVHIVKITSRDPAPPPVAYIKVSGGLFCDMMIHDFDLAGYLSGSEVVEVFASGAVLVDPAIGKAGDIDTAIVTLKFANGAIGVIDNSRQAVYGYDQRAEVFGSKGCAAVENEKPSTNKISNKDAVCEEKPLYFFLERYMQAYAAEVGEFVSAIKNGKDVPVGGDAGLASVVIAKAAMKSLKENRPVKISEME